jgi:purine-binding chemotaxis protein CheW
MVLDVIEFELGGETYAMDIQIAREIVEMLPITLIPRAPSHVGGLLNLRGEITTILNIHKLLGITPKKEQREQKIIVLTPEAADGSSVGIIVDEVYSVLTVDESRVDHEATENTGDQIGQYIHGIIKIHENDEVHGEGQGDVSSVSSITKLLIWIDVKQILIDTAYEVN